MGHVLRPPSRGGDSTDGGLLSLVEHERYGKSPVAGQSNPSPLVGIHNSYKDNRTHVANQSSNGNSHHIMNDNSSLDSLRHDALADLIASLSNGNNDNHNSASASAWQVLIDFIYPPFFAAFMCLLLSQAIWCMLCRMLSLLKLETQSCSIMANAHETLHQVAWLINICR